MQAKRRMHPMCVTCQIKKQQEAVKHFIPDTQDQLEYMRMVCDTVAENLMTDSPSLILYKIQKNAERFAPPTDLFKGAL